MRRRRPPWAAHGPSFWKARIAMFSVGMIGAGIIGASHLAAVAGHPDTRLAARSRRPHPMARTLMKAMKKCWSGKSWSL